MRQHFPFRTVNEGFMSEKIFLYWTFSILLNGIVSLLLKKVYNSLIVIFIRMSNNNIPIIPDCNDLKLTKNNYDS